MPRLRPTRAQLKIDFEVDERVEQLAGDFQKFLEHKFGPTTAELGDWSAELAGMAWRKFARHEEPGELIRCYACDHPTRHDERVRVVVCTRCALEGGSPGSRG